MLARRGLLREYAARRRELRRTNASREPGTVLSGPPQDLLTRRMTNELSGRSIAILATDGVERVELEQPCGALLAAGARTELLSIHGGTIEARQSDMEPAGRFVVDTPVSEASVDDYDALLLPGGTVNPDKLRMNAGAVAFVKAFVEAGKPVAAICHGPWTLVEADVVRGSRVTSWPSVKTDIRNAGGTWVDEEVVVDQGLVSSRKPDDLPAFCAKLVEEIAEGKHEAQRRSVSAA